MRKRRRYKGFSLTEVLLAVGTLAIGMIFISGTFLTGIHFSTISTEQTMAVEVADEAFAKISLYGINFDPALWQGNATYPVYPDQSVEFNAVSNIDPNEFAYPSTGTLTAKQYSWSALCRLVNERSWPDDPNRLVQVTVFVSRKLGSGLNWPKPVAVGVEFADTVEPVRKNRLRIVARPPNASGDKTLVNGGCTIADDRTGRLYRVLERYAAPEDDVIVLDRDWDDMYWHGNAEINLPVRIWVVPPPVGGGRYPCIGIYQKLIRF